MQTVASPDQANNETSADKDSRRKGEGSPYVRHDPNESEQEPNKGEGYADGVTPQQHVVSVL
jgi:hypothetical protein